MDNFTIFISFKQQNKIEEATTDRERGQVWRHKVCTQNFGLLEYSASTWKIKKLENDVKLDLRELG
jgi:hypothetical protein